MKQLQGGEVLYISGITWTELELENWDESSESSYGPPESLKGVVLRVDPGESQPVLVGQVKDDLEDLSGLLLCQN